MLCARWTQRRCDGRCDGGRHGVFESSSIRSRSSRGREGEWSQTLNVGGKGRAQVRSNIRLELYSVACKRGSWPSYRAEPGQSAYLRICVSAAYFGSARMCLEGILVQAPTSTHLSLIPTSYNIQSRPTVTTAEQSKEVDDGNHDEEGESTRANERKERRVRDGGGIPTVNGGRWIVNCGLWIVDEGFTIDLGGGEEPWDRMVRLLCLGCIVVVGT